MSPDRIPTTEFDLGRIKVLFRHSLRIDFSRKERWITPVFFAAIVLLLFSFAMPEPPPEIRHRMMIAQTMLAVFFGLQISLSRAFESESQDRVFDHLRLVLPKSSSFILAKMLHVVTISGFTAFFAVFLAFMLQGQDLQLLASPAMIAGFSLTILGLSGLGVLLASITLKADGQQILFPLLYFPLATPVLLCSTEGMVQWLDHGQWDKTITGWGTLLIAFDAIYVTLTLLLGSDTLEASS